MLRILSTLTAITLAIFSVQVAGQASNNDPNGKSFYISEPSCDYYQCQVTKHTNDTLKINWLNPLDGKININFVPQKSNGQTYRIARNISAHSNKSSCDKGGQNSCGSYDWKIPSNVVPGEYSVEIHSLYKKSVYGECVQRKEVLDLSLQQMSAYLRNLLTNCF
jgi:hypothetical protein